MKLPVGSTLTNKDGEKYTIEKIVDGYPWPWTNKPIPKDAKVKEFLGQGGFGITYLASRKIKVGGISQTHWFAIKEFFVKGKCGRGDDGQYVVFESLADEAEISGFIQEAQRLMTLDHPGIVKVVDVLEANNTAYYVMEYHEGGTLQQLVQPKEGETNPLSAPEVVNMMRQVLDAVNYLHSKHFMHCDIKPANIVLSNNSPVLIDFGEARHFNAKGEPTTTQKGSIGFTRGYSPVELMAGNVDRFTPKYDVYALGATIFCLLTGKDPLDSAQIVEQPDYFETHLGSIGIPDSLYQAIVRAMAYNINDRTKDVKTLMQEVGTAPMPKELPQGYQLRVGDDVFEILEPGNIGPCYIEYVAHRQCKSDRKGQAASNRYCLMEFFVDGSTERARDRSVMNVKRNGAEYEVFCNALQTHKTEKGFVEFEANGTVYYAYRLPWLEMWTNIKTTIRRIPPYVGYIVGVLVLAVCFYMAVSFIDWGGLFRFQTGGEANGDSLVTKSLKTDTAKGDVNGNEANSAKLSESSQMPESHVTEHTQQITGSASGNTPSGHSSGSTSASSNKIKTEEHVVNPEGKIKNDNVDQPGKKDDVNNGNSKDSEVHGANKYN